MSTTPESLHAGIDIGSTTVKLAVLDRADTLIFSTYERHHSDVQGSLIAIIEAAHEALCDAGAAPDLTVSITGSGGLSLSRWLEIPFVQEVIAGSRAVSRFLPDADVAIELGGEDAKITYFTGGLEQRMNGTCAGGTGAFIDQMATLLQTDAAGLNALASNHTTIYPIAARCGVFAKSDVQPLINEGARREDIAASVLQAVVNQTISGLACGKPIRGTVAFLGGPLHFLPETRKLFVKTLGLAPEEVRTPARAELFVAMGAALASRGERALSLTELRERVRGLCRARDAEVERMRPLFRDASELAAFHDRHDKARARRADIAHTRGPLFLGLDAGSTTTKAVLIDESAAIAWSAYRGNGGDPLGVATSMIKEALSLIPAKAWVSRACSTGYGEALVKEAFRLDEGEVETVAHHAAASEFLPGVQSILDIGGQDMKFLRISEGAISTILLNEACSSGCGSFLETFAQSLEMPVERFGAEALQSSAPVDLGSRCTVFMNSRVKQAQKEGAGVGDISAGLSYSVIRNALQKVIRLKSPEELGERVIVQGGTFLNDAVLRAFELVAGREAVRPDVAGLMGAYGAALLARGNAAPGARSRMLGLEELRKLATTVSLERCRGCQNRCMLTITRFSDSRCFVSGNRCERGARAVGGARAPGAARTRDGANLPEGERPAPVPNLYAWKYARVFRYQPLDPNHAPRGVVGIPRVLNMFEDYPFWFTFFTRLGFSVRLSPRTSRSVYEAGMETIPSETVCYPGKLVHGHIVRLVRDGVPFIFYPCLPYSPKEDKEASNHFNCPIVTSYPEVILNNVEGLRDGTPGHVAAVRYSNPFLPLHHPAGLKKRLAEELAWAGVGQAETDQAVEAGLAEQAAFKAEVRAQGERALEEIEARGIRGVVLAGRPYHMDPEINHGVPELIVSLGMAVLTEDSISHRGKIQRPLRVIDQWVYHTRLYAAASFAATRKDLALVQLTSFGCGLDAVATDQVQEILSARGRTYTLLKIDEQSNLGAARIRLRSLKAALDARAAGGREGAGTGREERPRAVFTADMRKTHTILAPQMSPIHFRVLESAFRFSGYNLEILPEVDRQAIDVGLTYVNNDACYPSVLVVGQMMAALRSGRYDLSRTALLISQTGGGCRATNYIAFIRKALADAGLDHVPVISVNALGLEKNPGFRLSVPLLARALMALVYGDLLMRMLYRVRPYEIEPGAADTLCARWSAACRASLKRPRVRAFHRTIAEMVKAFDSLPIREEKKPRVGVVGEILVKFHPTANNADHSSDRVRGGGSGGP